MIETPTAEVREKCVPRAALLTDDKLLAERRAVNKSSTLWPISARLRYASVTVLFLHRMGANLVAAATSEIFGPALADSVCVTVTAPAIIT